MKNKIMTVLSGVVILAAGCSRQSKSDLADLQGTWKGRQIYANPNIPEHSCSLVISGNNYEFQDEADTNAWNKGTFTLREDATPRQYIAVIGECRVPQFTGKTIVAIYRLENGTLKMTSSPPGKTEAPVAFDMRGTARMEYKRN
jgi:uncharacterized protein (TIGR03067 family)